MKEIQGAVLKKTSFICEVSNKVVKLKIKKDISDRAIALTILPT